MKLKLLLIITLISSCRKEISLDLNSITEKIVVQGSIEPFFPPYVILTRNQGFFDPITNETYNNLFIKDAEVIVWKEKTDGTIDSVILEQLPPPFDSLPIYTDINYITSSINNPYLFSQEGERYNLTIRWNGETVTSTTTIPYSTPLDSIWINPTENQNDKPFKSEIRAVYTDPDSIGNNILIRSKRTQHFIRDTISNYYPLNQLIQDNDENLILVDCGPDILINGESFETYFPRPIEGGLPLGDYNSSHYKRYQDTTTSGKDSVFAPNDIVILKFSQVDAASMQFWRGVVRNITSGSNPFSEPMNLPSNINGGLGVWTGYGAIYYKIPIIQDTIILNQYSPNIFDIF